MMIDKVKEIIAKQLRIEAADIDCDTSLTEDLGADSLDMVELLMAFEEELGIVIPDETAAGLKTVREIAEYLEANE
ncbi:MAG: acyl carrier protein [Eubacteriales bacterium]